MFKCMISWFLYISKYNSSYFNCFVFEKRITNKRNIKNITKIEFCVVYKFSRMITVIKQQKLNRFRVFRVQLHLVTFCHMRKWIEYPNRHLFVSTQSGSKCNWRIDSLRNPVSHFSMISIIYLYKRRCYHVEIYHTQNNWWLVITDPQKSAV